tara:strand:- start:335 stop:613 length:279 start_codon:yes stop_codon:yes gene_type:complete
MKQILDSLISALKELEEASKTEDVTRLEEKAELIINDLNGLITENKFSKDDKELKQKVDVLGQIIKNLDQNQKQRSNTFTEFMRYLKDRKIN